MSYKDIVATLGTYDKGGYKKYLTRKVGTLVETDKGLRIKLEASFNPAGLRVGEDGCVWLAVFDPKPREEFASSQSARHQAPRPAHAKVLRDSAESGGGFDTFDSDIPFANICREVHIC